MPEPTTAAAPPALPGAPPTPGRQAVFIRRLVSAVILWSLVLGGACSGIEACYFILIGGFGLAGLWEFYKMLDAKRLPNFKIFGMICGAMSFIGSFYFFYEQPGQPFFDYEIGVVLIFLFGVFGRQLFVRKAENSPIETMSYTLFGLLYVPLLFNFITKIIYVVPHPPHAPAGVFYVIYLVAVAKFSDMGAYLMGSLIGRHKMIPHISPSKTWEGFGGALLFSLAISFGLRALIPGKLALLSWVDAGVLGLTLSVAAVIGDLAESILKRSTGVKDSGRTLPGIGGVLDLIDSLLFTAPILYFYLRVLVGRA